MIETKSLADYKAEIWLRLKELSEINPPQFRSYRRPDGTEADREPVPEYIEQERLRQIWCEIMAYEGWFHRCHNRLLISLRLDIESERLLDHLKPAKWDLLHRIAVSVYQNASVCD